MWSPQLVEQASSWVSSGSVSCLLYAESSCSLFNRVDYPCLIWNTFHFHSSHCLCGGGGVYYSLWWGDWEEYVGKQVSCVRQAAVSPAPPPFPAYSCLHTQMMTRVSAPPRDGQHDNGPTEEPANWIILPNAVLINTASRGVPAGFFFWSGMERTRTEMVWQGCTDWSGIQCGGSQTQFFC